MKRYLFILLFLGMPVLAFPFLISAKSYDLFVDSSYEGEEDGSKEKPFNTIGEAVEAAMKNSSSSRNIYLRNGEYKEKATLENSIKIYGENRKDVVITNTLTMKDGTEIKNITISGGHQGVLIEKNADVAIEDCDIRNFSGMGIQASPGGGLVTIKNNDIYNGKGGKGMYIQEGRRVEILGNNVHNNGQEGMDVRARVSGTIEKNSINSNGESGIEFIIGSSKLEIKNNDIRNNGASAIASQFYRGTSKTGKITIIGNILSKNKKFGLDCAIPSGGSPSAEYWGNSMELSQNTIEKNKIRPISNFCNMMQAIEEEKEKEDNIISETVEEENDSKENMPKEVTSSEEMPTEEAVVLPEFPDEEKKKLDGSVNVVLSRNGVKTFFIGPDYKNIQIAKEELEKMKNARVELFRLLKEVKTVENKNAVKERIAEMSDIINSSETHIYKQENKFSLFGWFYEIILDKK